MSGAANSPAAKATATPEQAPVRATPEAADGAGVGVVPFDGAYGPGMLGMLAAGDAGVTGRTLTALQRNGGNGAVSQMLHANPLASGRSVQRIPMDSNPANDPAVREYNSVPTGYAAMSDPEKIKAIEGMFGTKSPRAIASAWAQLTDELGQARANADLFARSVKADDDILDHTAFDGLKELFKKDVEQQALGNLASNRLLVQQEMERTGVSAEDTGKQADAAQDMAVQDVQKAAPDMERIVQAKQKALSTVIGKETILLHRPDGDLKEIEQPATFSPSGPPDRYERLPETPTWEQINEQWQRIVAAEAALIRKYPTAAYLLGAGSKEIGGFKAADIKNARATISRALHDLAGKIDKAVPLIGDDLKFLDFPPIHQQLLAGAGASSGTNWSKPVERLLIKEEIGDATLVNTLKTLGVATVAAAFFIFASIATAGGAAALGAVLFAGGAIVGVGQAAASWDKYRDLSAAHAATVDPELALVSGEQVDEAAITAILDSIFAVLDVAQAAKGAYVGLKGGKVILEAGKAGVKGTARAALAGLKTASNKAEVIAKAMAEIGPEEVRRLSGHSFDDLAELVGKESALGKRLLGYGAKGAISASAKELLEKLPKIAELGAKEGEDVLKASMEAYGALGTLNRVKGGWAALKKTAAMKTAAGEAMEAWRKGIVREMEDFIAEESGKMSKAVRTGTPAAASDVDVQIVGGAASELTQKAEGWLAGRLGKNVKDAKLLIDAEIFIDPLRSHLIDIMKDLEPAVRAEISQRMTGIERQMIYGARYKEALKTSKEAAEKVLKEAEGLGIKPFMEFEPLTAAAQKRVSGQIDGWMKELAQTADPKRKADLIEQISRAQASITASHPDAYVGGGVRVWVTGRDEDVAALAKALGIAEADLKAASVAQRVTAALSEAKWLDAAVNKLAAPSASSLDDLPKLTNAITDIGKHGGRAAEQLGKAGAPNAERLAELFGKLKALKEMPADQVAKTIKGGELGRLRGEIDGILNQLKSQTKTAVEGIGAEAKTLNAAASDLAEFQKLLAWQVRYGVLVEGAKDATAAYVKVLEAALQEKLQASLPPSTGGEPNYQPKEGPPVNVQPLRIQRQVGVRPDRPSDFARPRIGPHNVEPAGAQLIRVQRQPPAPSATAGSIGKAPPPASGLHGIPHEGKQLTADFREMEALMERVVAEKGWPEAESWAYRFINADPLRDPIDIDKDLIGRVRQRLKTETEQMRAKVREQIRDFERAATDNTTELLKNSEKQLKAEAERYGLKVTESWIFLKDYSMKESERGPLQEAAKILASKRRECNRALNEFAKLRDQWKDQGKISPFLKELNEPLEQKRAEWVKLEDEYLAMANEKQKTHPVLAAYTTLDDAAAKLDQLSTQSNEALAESLQKTLQDRLDNIKTVREGIGDRYSIWKTPQIMALTKKTQNVKPWESRVVEDHARQVKAAEGESAKVFAAIAIGLGLLAAIPTGGTSILAGVAAAGAALGAAYSIHNLYEHYKDYQLASAETGTHLDKAQAISQDEPGLLWLASDLLDLGMNVVGAATAFKALRSAMVAAEVSKLEKLPQVIEKANELGLNAAVRSKVIAHVVERSGGAANVKTTLAKMLETFEHLQPTVDSRLAKAYREAAHAITTEGRLGVYTNGGREGLAEIKRVLGNANVSEPQLTRYAKQIAADFAANPGREAAYYNQLDVVFMRQGASADFVAHELAHRAQNVLGELRSMGTMRAEYQAYSAQREFLLMLPGDKVPADSLWLLRATDTDIKAHILKHYKGELGKELAAGQVFEALDDQADAAAIVDLFKIATKRGLM